MSRNLSNIITNCVNCIHWRKDMEYCGFWHEKTTDRGTCANFRMEDAECCENCERWDANTLTCTVDYYRAEPDGCCDKYRKKHRIGVSLAFAKTTDHAAIKGEILTNDPHDVQIGGNHYAKMAIQPIDFIQANGLGFCEGNVIKYVCRHRDKNGKQDLQKAIHYLELLMAHEYPETDKTKVK